MHPTILLTVGARLGRLLEVDVGEDGSCTGKFARIRVMMDISKPLRQGIWVKQERLEDEICILLRYERLPQFCFQCGCLGHSLRDCSLPHVDAKDCSFGSWLRAPVGWRDRKSQYVSHRVSNSRNSIKEFPNEVNDGFGDGLITEKYSSPIVGYASAIEKNGLNICLSTPAKHFTPSETDSMGQEVDEGPDSITKDKNISLSTIQSSKKKLKRLARGDTSVQSDMEDQPSNLGSAKRRSNTPLDFVDKKKKAKS